MKTRPIIETYPAEPKYSLGQVVWYLDHTQRVQEGVIKMITAHWGRFNSANPRPYISVEVTHPTYRNRIIYLREDDILGPGPMQKAQ